MEVYFILHDTSCNSCAENSILTPHTRLPLLLHLSIQTHDSNSNNSGGGGGAGAAAEEVVEEEEEEEAEAPAGGGGLFGDDGDGDY